MAQKEMVLISQSDITELIRKKEYLYGLNDLCNYLSICRTSASKLTKERLEGCYFKTGKRKLIFDKEKVIERLESKTL